MIKKSDLLKAFDLASKETHTRTFHFDFGPGVDLICPRLSLGNQAIFERRMVAKPESKGFSLSMMRNTSAMRMADCSAKVLGELRAGGAPEKFENEVDSRLWATQFQASLIAKFAPYAEKLFGGFDKDDQIFAVTMALQQYYGESQTKVTGKGDKRTEEEVPIDEDFMRVIFGAQPDKLDTMFLWTIGLVDIPEGTETKDVAAGLADLAKQIGGSGNAREASRSKS